MVRCAPKKEQVNYQTYKKRVGQIRSKAPLCVACSYIPFDFGKNLIFDIFPTPPPAPPHSPRSSFPPSDPSDPSAQPTRPPRRPCTPREFFR